MLSSACKSNCGHPIATVLWLKLSRDYEHNVDDPPHSQAAQRQKLAHGGAGLAQAKPVQADEAQEDGIEEGGQEVVVRVSHAGVSGAQEGSLPAALDAVQRAAADRGALHLLPALSAKVQAAVAELQFGGGVAGVVYRLVTLQKLPGQKGARKEGMCGVVVGLVLAAR